MQKAIKSCHSDRSQTVTEHRARGWLSCARESEVIVKRVETRGSHLGSRAQVRSEDVMMTLPARRTSVRVAAGANGIGKADVLYGTRIDQPKGLNTVSGSA